MGSIAAGGTLGILIPPSVNLLIYGSMAETSIGQLFVAGIVPGLVGLGAGGQGAHAPGETVDLTTLERQGQRAALLMYRLSREPRRRAEGASEWVTANAA